MALQSNKSRQTACQKRADPADSESLTRGETALPVHPSLRQLELDGENIKEAEATLVAVGKLLGPFPPPGEPEDSIPICASNISINPSRHSSHATHSVMLSPSLKSTLLGQQHIVRSKGLCTTQAVIL